jgi:long-chain acyl-CoA synthetase
MRLEKVLGAHALRHAGKPAMRCGSRSITYGELHASSQRLARGLARLGVRAGDRVMIYLPNGTEFVQAFYAALALGALVVPVNTRLAAKELDHLIEDSRPAAFVFHDELRETVAAITTLPRGVTRIAVGGAPRADAVSFEELLDARGEEALPELSADSVDCMIAYTSGTTGRPKGAVITHANLLVAHGFLNAVDWGISGEDRYLVTTPLAHRTGLARLMNALCLGGTVIAMSKFEPAAVLDVIEREQVTVAGMVPTVARMLLPHLRTGAGRCASLRRIVVTGEAFPVGLKQEIISLLPHVRLCSFFAMTEVGSVTSLSHEEQFTHATSVGRVIPGVEVKLVDEGGRGVPVGEVGELLVRSGEPGRFVTMREYYGQPEATAATITDGWVRTGDLARFDADGYLYIVDRKKDMVLSGGFNIYTKEVERVLVDHPAVADAAVVGVPDPVFGEAVAACVELLPGARVTAQELIEHCRASIASYKKPKYVYFVDALPRNALGKVLKAALREYALKQLPAGDRVP